MKLLLVLVATLAVACAGIVDSSLQVAVENGETVAILELPQMMGQVETNQALQALAGDAKVSALVSALKVLTSSMQAPFISIASSLGLKTEQFWASNIILIKGLTPEKLASLAAKSGDFIIRKSYTVSILPADENITLNIESNNVTQNLPQWGVAKIRAPAVWPTTTGEGVVVAIIDTGVNHGHEALNAGYAGAWMDPINNTALPTDINGHGSHCAGTIVGRTNGIGVAPGARWIACRGLDHNGNGQEHILTQCAQFMLTANPRPHVVSHSWGGGSGVTWYNSQILAMRSAGIIPVFANGNFGPTCPSSTSPGDQPNLISVGATTDTDAIATFSSRGPNPNGVLKPELSAPGSNTLSCGTGVNDYVTLSGTSMACF